MGYKSSWKRKYLLYCIAVNLIVAAVNLTACAPFQEKIAAMGADRQLEESRKNLAAGYFESVIDKSMKVIEQSETESPADVALYALGEVYAHHDFEGRDLALSKYYFDKLNANFPESPLASEAKIYLSLFETIAAKEKDVVALQEKSMQLESQRKKERNKAAATTTLPRKVVENNNFKEAVERNMQVLKDVGNKKPADEALYNLGLIYAHVDNPAKDYQKSQIYFHVLTRQFPESVYAEEARIWLGLFETIEKIQQIDIEIEQQKKQMIR